MLPAAAVDRHSQDCVTAILVFGVFIRVSNGNIFRTADLFPLKVVGMFQISLFNEFVRPGENIVIGKAVADAPVS